MSPLQFIEAESHPLIDAEVPRPRAADNRAQRIDAEAGTHPMQPPAQSAPLLRALLVQGSAALVAVVVMHGLGGDLPAGYAALLAGALAALLGAAVRLPSWWLPINLLMPPAAMLLLASGIPAPAYFIVFLLLWLANSTAWRGRVPLYLSSRAAVSALLPLLPTRPGFRLLDLGCGTGSALVPLIQLRPDGCYSGIEMSPLSFLVSRLRTLRSATRVNLRWGDFWALDLSRYDVVYAYLSPAAMLRLWSKAQNEMRPGALLVSNSFAVPGAAPLQVIRYSAERELYVWRM